MGRFQEGTVAAKRQGKVGIKAGALDELVGVHVDVAGSSEVLVELALDHNLGILTGEERQNLPDGVRLPGLIDIAENGES